MCTPGCKISTLNTAARVRGSNNLQLVNNTRLRQLTNHRAGIGKNAAYQNSPIVGVRAPRKQVLCLKYTIMYIKRSTFDKHTLPLLNSGDTVVRSLTNEAKFQSGLRPTSIKPHVVFDHFNLRGRYSNVRLLLDCLCVTSIFNKRNISLSHESFTEMLRFLLFNRVITIPEKFLKSKHLK